MQARTCSMGGRTGHRFSLGSLQACGSTLALTGSLRQSRSWTTRLGAGSNSDPDHTLQAQLEALERDMAKLNGGKAINLNSPKQIAIAIFGDIQSTSRQALLDAAKGSANIGQQQQSLAALVLQYKELSRQALRNFRTPVNDATQQKQQTVGFSTMAQIYNECDVIMEEQVVEGKAIQPKPTSIRVSSPRDINTSHDQVVESLFRGKSKIPSFWKDPLLQVTKPSARAMVAQLNSKICPIGYDPLAAPYDPLRAFADVSVNTLAGKKGSLLAYVREQKEKYEDCIILTRVGEFYETYGVDAVLLAQHCGLNAMAGKARAGCPVRNVQATLDCLTACGFRVAVYEEATDTDASAGAGASAGAKSRLKNRMLAQIVSSASPTYLYDLVLLGNADALVTSPASRPHMGVISTMAGYTLVEVSIEERNVRVSERLTAEAIACRIAAYPPADPLIYVPPPSDVGNDIRDLPFLPSRSDVASDGSGSRLRTKILPPALMQDPAPGISDVERARNTIVGFLLQIMERADDRDTVVAVEDFSLISSSFVHSGVSCTQTNPLYMETATQLGLMSEKSIPPLISFLLPDSAPAATRRFLRRWLLTPPPPMVATAMASLVSYLKDFGPALPPLSVPPTGKVLALLRAGQASAQVYAELLVAMDATIAVLEAFDHNGKRSSVVDPLMTLLEHESGIAADPQSLRSRCLRAMEVIENVISPIHHVRSNPLASNEDQITDYGGLLPRAFFERNEASWRGRVRCKNAQESYDRVHRTARHLAEAVATDFWGKSDATPFDEFLMEVDSLKNPIVQDIFNNIFAIKEVPVWAKHSGENRKSRYFHPNDRNGKILRNRYTSASVQVALAAYVEACEQACREVTSELTKLSRTLCEAGHLPAVVQAAHSNLILSTANNHATHANALGWHMAHTYEGRSMAGQFQNVWPYWMDRSEAVSNSFNISGLFLLTAPNMSGKSTLMRATASAALLSNCGLCAPLSPDSSIRRFDNIFVRGASADVPTEQKSAFGAEMGDVAALLRSCGEKSLVFVDELGRGTSPKDGTCLAGAVLESMAEAGMSGMFATHLHEVLDLPMNGRDRITMKRMAIQEKGTGGTDLDYTWTYRLEDGVCTDSLALVTAARFGVPEAILQRAAGFTAFVSDNSITRRSATHDFSNEQQYPVRNGRNGFHELATTDLQRAIRIAEDVIGQDAKALEIPPRWSSPPSLEGHSCVYILELDVNPPRYYVGETDSLQRRLGQHRAKGGVWSQLRAVALPVAGGKTHARSMESLVVQKLAKAGFQLQSMSDGRSIRSTGLS